LGVSPGISKFLEVYAPTVAATDQLWTWGLEHIQVYVKLYILLGGWLFLRRSDRVGAGKCVKISKIWDIPGYGCTHRLAIDMGVVANERGGQTTYTIRRWTFLKVICWS